MQNQSGSNTTFRNTQSSQDIRNSSGIFNSETSASLGVKDLSIIEDQLSHEALAYKKWTVYSGYFQDQQLKTMAQSTAQHHKQHFDTLQNYLNNHR